MQRYFSIIVKKINLILSKSIRLAKELFRKIPPEFWEGLRKEPDQAGSLLRSVRLFRGSPFDVPLWDSLIVAVALVLGGYILVLPLIGSTMMGRVFISCGWIGQMISVLGTWSMVIIILKIFL